MKIASIRNSRLSHLVFLLALLNFNPKMINLGLKAVQSHSTLFLDNLLSKLVFLVLQPQGRIESFHDWKKGGWPLKVLFIKKHNKKILVISQI